MKAAWYRFCHWLCAWIYFERITILHPERVSRGGPVLYIGLHRNGAVDGFVYRRVAPRCAFLVSTQLLRSFFARMFFHGIPVARPKDAERGEHNDAALRQCVDRLAAGGEVFVFPEGTSSLGPRHLPFKSGAARIAVAAVECGVPLRIVPLGIHYERAWAFRSKVEVVVGQAISTTWPAELSGLGRLQEMRRRMTSALEEVGVNFESADTQKNAERLAYAATLGTARSYFDSLKSFESGVPEPLLSRWRQLELNLTSCHVLRHQDVPLFPVAPWMFYILWLLGLLPLVLIGVLVNCPPLLAGWLAARRLADQRNVIALWRILVGLPLFVLWFAGLSTVLALMAGWLPALVYVVVTLTALQGFYRVKKLGVIVWNGLVHRPLAARACELRELMLQTLHSA